MGQAVYFICKPEPCNLVCENQELHAVDRSYVARFANGYCSRVGGKVGGWAKLCTCLMGNALLITWRSFANPACYPYTSYYAGQNRKVTPGSEQHADTDRKQGVTLCGLICFNKSNLKRSQLSAQRLYTNKVACTTNDLLQG